MSGIRFAWCKELDDVLTARDAKREFLALDPRPEGFSFFCQNPDCKRADGKPTRVTCVNYRKAPSEQDQSVVVHYRQLDEHIPTCDDYDPEEAPQIGGTPKKTRTPGLKAADAYDVFDPADDPESGGVKRPSIPGAEDSSPGGRARGGGSGSGGKPRGRSPSKTRFVEDLAALHVQAKTDPSAAALLERDIRIVGGGTAKLRDMFSHLYKGASGTKAIWYGGAHIKVYGKAKDSFALFFIDAVEGKKLSTYVSSAQVEQYRYRKQLLELMAEAEHCRYVTAYVWGSIEPADMEGKLKLQPTRLQHLAIILGPPKTQPAQVVEDSSLSSNSNK